VELGPVQLLIVQGTPFCNLNCTYCYLPDRDNKSRIQDAVVRSLAVRLREEALVGPRLRVCWHAGEPLVYPLPLYERFVKAFQEELGSQTDLEFSTQTNGVLLDGAWCEFFVRNGVTVGVSLDGPKDLNDRFRLDRLGQGTFDRAVKGLRLLQDYGIDTHVIAVLHRFSLGSPDLLFDFFQKLGVKSVCFNVEEHEGINGGTSLDSQRSVAESEHFFRRYFELVMNTPGAHWVREYSDTMKRLCATNPVFNSEATPLSILTVDHKGNYFTFSPELAGISCADFPEGFALGNVLDRRVTIRQATRAHERLLSQVEQGIHRCKSECQFFAVCGGGSSSNKLAETGSLASSETLHCRVTIQAQVRAMLALLADRAGRANVSPTRLPQ
jgi:uncharacterized protein